MVIDDDYHPRWTISRSTIPIMIIINDDTDEKVCPPHGCSDGDNIDSCGNCDNVFLSIETVLWIMTTMMTMIMIAMILKDNYDDNCNDDDDTNWLACSCEGPPTYERHTCLMKTMMMMMMMIIVMMMITVILFQERRPWPKAYLQDHS